MIWISVHLHMPAKVGDLRKLTIAEGTCPLAFVTMQLQVIFHRTQSLELFATFHAQKGLI